MKQRKNKNEQDDLWAAVEVERGYVSQVKILKSFTKADRVAKTRGPTLNPDYDDAAVLKAG